MLGIYDIEVFDFEFYPETSGNDRNKYDLAIYNTLVNILSSFFISEMRVLVSICDSTDGRHKARHSLFGIWYKKNGSNLVARESLEIKIGDEVTYANIFFRNDFPHTQVLHAHLIDKAREIIGGKF